MPTVKLPTVNKIISELSFRDYISKKKELKRIVRECKSVLDAQSKKTYDQKEQLVNTLNFIEAIWNKYDCKEIAEIFVNFVKIEEALYGLERDEEKEERYRDHFVHMFNIFIFGLRIISILLKKIRDVNKAKKLFKVEDENLKKIGLPFSSNYNYKQRLFYLWTLISTFHDVAIPFQHLTKIGKGINRFVEEFGWIFTGPSISMRNFDSSQLHNYFCLLSYIYGGALQLDEYGRKYKRCERPQDYLVKILGREFDNRNHGVLSGFLMWKTIEEIFLLDRSKKYKFGVEQFNLYSEYVLEQDIARAALAISVHSLKEDQKSEAYPKIFPVDFETFPLTFLLILSDELQEYLRWEGTSIKRNIKFKYSPKLELNFSHSGIKLKTIFSLDDRQKDYIIRQAKIIAKRKNLNSTKIANVGDASKTIGNSIKENLEKKLKLGRYFKLKIEIYKDWTKKLYGKELNTRN